MVRDGEAAKGEGHANPESIALGLDCVLYLEISLHNLGLYRFF